MPKQTKPSPDGRERRRNYYRAHADLIKRLVHESYIRHREARLSQKAQYRSKNYLRIKEDKQVAYYADLQTSRERLRQSYARHFEQRRADRRRYCRENPDLVREINARTQEKRRISGKA